MSKYQKLSPDERAAVKAIRGISVIGQPRHNNKNDGKVHSIGTARQYEQTFRMASKFCRSHGTRLHKITIEQAQQFLGKRSEEILQKQLNNEKRALQYHLNNINNGPPIKLSFVVSQRQQPEPKSRAYTREQIQHLVLKSEPKLALSIKISYTAGLRVEELLTIQRSIEKAPSTHRNWNADIYTGRKHWASYTVTGKGGLSREVRIPSKLSEELEQARRDEITIIKDRHVSYESRYDLIGGRAFTDQFKRLSERELFFNNGPHGLRHSYVQERIKSLQNHGHDYENSERILAQEIGHFSTSNLHHYYV